MTITSLTDDKFGDLLTEAESDFGGPISLASGASMTFDIDRDLTLDGGDSDWTRTVRDVGRALGERTGLPVHYIDERLTSVRAERAVRSLGLPKKKREEKGRIDAAAAILILQAWLDLPADQRPESR